MGFTLNISVACQSRAVYISHRNKELISLVRMTGLFLISFFVSFPLIFPHLPGVVGAWGARRLGGGLTTAGRVVAAVLPGGVWVSHQEGELSEVTLQRQKHLTQSEHSDYGCTI